MTKTEYEYKTTNVIKTTTYTYDSTWKDLLVSYDGKAITTDAIGNVLTYDGKTYSWRNGRELAGITDGNNTISYTYNEDGVRTSKTVNGVTTTYELNGTNVVYEKTGDTIIYYIYDGVGDIVGFEYSGNKYYYKKNLQGDIVGIYDNTLQEIVSYTYDSWGKLVSIKDANGQEITSTTHVGYINPYRYRSYRYDNESGLYYLQSRYYNADWGRFISADSIIAGVGNTNGYNLFAYCNNNPINMVDEDGDFAALALIVGVAKIAATVVLVASAVKGLAYVGGMAYLTYTENENARDLYHNAFFGQGKDKSYGNNSKISTSIVNDKDFVKKIKDTTKIGQCNDIVPSNFEFTSSDLYYALQHVDYYASVQQNDSRLTYSVTITDTYNFDGWRTGNGFADTANNIGYVLQSLKLIKPYDVTIQIMFEE